MWTGSIIMLCDFSVVQLPFQELHLVITPACVMLRKRQVSVSLSCTPSVSVIILYPECQCHYPVPQVSVSLSCTPS
ncbi:unnamed protein product, partial [Ranitomeya imitator]